MTEPKVGFWQSTAAIAVIIAVVAVAIVAQRHHKREVEVPLRAPAISGLKLELSALSQTELTNFLKKEELVVGVQVVAVDLVKNERRTTFFQADSVALTAVWEEYLTRRVAPPAAFSSAASQNDRVTSIINGNFDCRKFRDTIGFQNYPAADPIAPMVCAISVPASFDGSGDFVGFINFFVTRPLSDQETRRLSKHAIDLATSIYKRDIQPKK